MKNTTVLMAGLTTCITVLHAQSVYSNSLSDNDHPTVIEPLVYREIIWMNGEVFPSVETQFLTNGGFYNVNPIRAAESDHSATNGAYQVIALSPEAVGPSAASGGIRSWTFGAPGRIPTAQQEETGKKKPAQILYIEPLSAPRGNAPDRSIFREYMMTENRPIPAWYEWINPRVFLPKWTELWMTETDATPVVLVMAAF